MSAMQEEALITCPSCRESLDVLLDMSVPAQDYIEDCQVCCRPMRITYSSEDGVLTGIEVQQDT
ncbi:MAG: CPXCG motif-containing cysteine-rich protein [Chromatiales bacterium]|nr:CPXCG motif-containing cysteine-rich protein [Chromatiales bacterium]